MPSCMAKGAGSHLIPPVGIAPSRCPCLHSNTRRRVGGREEVALPSLPLKYQGAEKSVTITGKSPCSYWIAFLIALWCEQLRSSALVPWVTQTLPSPAPHQSLLALLFPWNFLGWPSVTTMVKTPGFFTKACVVPKADRRKHHCELHEAFCWMAALLQSSEQTISEPSHVSGLVHTVQDSLVSKLKPDREFGPQFNQLLFI